MAKPKYYVWLEKDNLIKIEAWARNGLTEEQIAKNMGIAIRTLSNWKNSQLPIMQALKRGKEVVDYEVENALLKKALGYEYDEEKTYIQEVDGKITKRKEITKKHIAGDTTAQIFWLKNRKPVEWRDRKETNLNANVKNININPYEQFSKEELREMWDSIEK